MLEDIVKRTVEVLPRYGSTFWALLAHPVAQVTPRSRAGTAVWDAVLFWAVSVAILLLTRYIAFSSDAAPTLFFVARGLSSILQLLLVSLAFFWVWRLFGARHPLGSFLIATACIHGVVLPLEAVLQLGSFGVMRIIGEDLFRLSANSVSGCGQVTTLAALQAALQDNPQTSLRPILLYIVTTLPMFGVLIGYGIAYCRILARLAEGPARFGPARLLLMFLLGGTLALIGLSFAALFDWILFNNSTLCLTPAPPFATD
ncbi:hypothetical protein [Sedimentitalea todarodis]|uniref:Yip1 domain-containing protein n=1 Tax=Sedimentitalea todarodis TaxID=1631240 RepID=A0ABU3VK40_9RHOB|nr:hypothetical protein [Sedimentitalea todarodis]MDU9006563.1 hypothetical protein [Sedimentitalea todarodis]